MQTKFDVGQIVMVFGKVDNIKINSDDPKDTKYTLFIKDSNEDVYWAVFTEERLMESYINRNLNKLICREFADKLIMRLSDVLHSNDIPSVVNLIDELVGEDDRDA